jgi:hypothetical protein
MTPAAAYLFAFALDLAAAWWHARPTPGRHHEREMIAIAENLAATDCGALECLTLMGTAGLESGWERSAVGRAGELGALQVMPFAWTTPAQKKEWLADGSREALRRLRVQGMLGYVGCAYETEKCLALVEHRTFPAKLYYWSHDPPAPWKGPWSDGPTLMGLPDLGKDRQNVLTVVLDSSSEAGSWATRETRGRHMRTIAGTDLGAARR